MTETPFFFSGGPNAPPDLFGILHDAAPSSRPAVVMCAPFGEEKLWAHRVLVSSARALAAAGYPVLRFDYGGTGESEGEHAAATLSTTLADVRRAIAHARTVTSRDRVALVGVRFGAAIAGLAAEESGDVSHLALWAPVMDGARYMQELLRSNLSGQLAAYKTIRHDRAALVAMMEQGSTVNIDGYELCHGMYRECSSVSFGKGPLRFGGPCLIAQVDVSDAAPPNRELEGLRDAYGRATLVRVVEDPFWKEGPVFCGRADRLTQATLDWLAAS
jgi:alpha/beta superfamily hydrolase